MVSQQQVYALYHILSNAIDKYYSEKINEIDQQIKNLEEEIVEDIFGGNTDYDFEHIMFEDYELQTVTALLKVHHPDFHRIKKILQEKEELQEEWHKKKEILEIYKDLLLISKDSLIDKPDLPKELERFLFIAVDSLYREE